MLSRLRGQDPGTNLRSRASLTGQEGNAHLKALPRGERAAPPPGDVMRLGRASGRRNGVLVLIQPLS